MARHDKRSRDSGKYIPALDDHVRDFANSGRQVTEADMITKPPGFRHVDQYPAGGGDGISSQGVEKDVTVIDDTASEDLE